MMSTLGKCTACDEDALADAKGEPHIHPHLGVLLCERCLGRDTRVFELDVRIHQFLVYHYSQPLLFIVPQHAPAQTLVRHRSPFASLNLHRTMVTNSSVDGAG